MENLHKTKILMVCLGNICRSPLAEGIMRNKISVRGLHAEVKSCGTSNYHISESADDRMVATARRHGIDISKHSASQFSVKDFDYYHKIFVMDGSNYRDVLRIARNEEDCVKVQKIMEMVEPGKGYDVPDPYYSGNDGFELVYNMLDEACEKIADLIENQTL